ncbi:hypothetical protein Tco_0961944 [Tanacetum coccineum]
MMKRVADFVKSEEAYKSELPKGENSEKGQGAPYKGNRPPSTGHADIQGWTTTVGGIITNHMFLHGHTTRCMITEGHYTNDCYQLKRQLEAALESEKLSHLIKDVRQRGNNRGRQ